MKESDPLPTLLPTATKKQQPLADTGRNRYKLCALAAILLLAAYSLLTGTAATLSSSSSDAPGRHPDLDILEVQERERFVEQMWELYAHGAHRGVRLPSFWRAAFEAAYEELAGDDGASRGNAVSEIARMSMTTRFHLDPESSSSSSSRRSDAVANAAKVKQHQIIGRTKARLSSMASSGNQ
ncbi:uncharacterized protein M6B38_277025 [Iris pallida]|uniref:Uncharacterized protein n=1 Tax=Iris pallida TaxID=29817 RepID=A0AAX6I2W1_IRIPA|nr:uncharacterized protein M6B38_277025 [Iris pallida]